jgi:hypothetical protein
LAQASINSADVEAKNVPVSSNFMPTEQILALLIAERDRLNRAIEALGGGKRRGRPPGRKPAASAPTENVQPPVRRKRRLSAAGRKAIAEAARKRWAAIKAGKAASPFAKRAKRKAA